MNEQQIATTGLPGVSMWFAATAPNIQCIRDEAEVLAELGEHHPWRDCIDFGQSET
ncbi:hypothetical protein [Nocardia otitidiscaviarum]|uniref:hypothetical protein n=1 Tax=Nocardia otitidiscaviarum TaxID=1823 RepID=UPI00189317AE|nr:hypothetical protein [Nocardia otitidiscaviarum]MBF6181273.1 hypothetical protein [Nocardia otitidiscaviarum]